MKTPSWLRVWWEGVFVPHHNDPDETIVILGGYYRRHWTSNLSHTVFDFWLIHWQWTIGTILAVLAIFITASQTQNQTTSDKTTTKEAKTKDADNKPIITPHK